MMVFVGSASLSFLAASMLTDHLSYSGPFCYNDGHGKEQASTRCAHQSLRDASTQSNLSPLTRSLLNFLATQP